MDYDNKNRDNDNKTALIVGGFVALALVTGFFMALPANDDVSAIEPSASGEPVAGTTADTAPTHTDNTATTTTSTTTAAPTPTPSVAGSEAASSSQSTPSSTADTPVATNYATEDDCTKATNRTCHSVPCDSSSGAVGQCVDGYGWQAVVPTSDPTAVPEQVETPSTPADPAHTGTGAH